MKQWVYNLIPVRLIDLISERSHNYHTFLKFIKNVDPNFLEKISEKKALQVFKQAKKNISAYQQFLEKNQVNSDHIKNIADFNSKLPIIDKHNYVMKYSLLDRTENKIMPKKGLLVESSGSTSKLPTNWFRTMQEERAVRKDVEFETKYLFGENKKFIVISAWSLGAWTTSLSFCYYFEPLGIVKNIGPDVGQIIQTIKTMGSQHNYLIAGYPPFIKHLIDTGRINWKKHNIDLVVGGEGFIPGWRDYVQSKLKPGAKIISAYGASDLETGMGVETPLSQYIRDLFIKEPQKVKKLFGAQRTPMFFQYNPLRFYINNLPKKKEFHTTVLTKGHVGVKVKYNINDLGGKKSYVEMIELLRKEFPNFNERYEQEFKADSLKLPFLWIAGRTDSVISLGGVNIYPQQIEVALLKNKKIYQFIQSFQMSKRFLHEGDHHFLIKIELQEKVEPTEQLAQEIKKTLKRNLSRISKAYELGLKDFPACYEPYVELFEYRTGPFDNHKAKNKYIN